MLTQEIHAAPAVLSIVDTNDRNVFKLNASHRRQNGRAYARLTSDTGELVTGKSSVAADIDPSVD